VFVLVVDIFLVLVCALENIQFWRLQTMREAATASSSYRDGDDFSETYSNPNFDRGPPTPYDAQVPYQQRTPGIQAPYEPQPAYDSRPTYGGGQGDADDQNGSAAMLPPPPPPPPPEGNGVDGIVSSGSRTVISVNNGADLTYQNPTFEERSPSQRRRPNREPRYGNV
ncbi:unnamed protein product, partial [Ixodes hexagonus]